MWAWAVTQRHYARPCEIFLEAWTEISSRLKQNVSGGWQLRSNNNLYRTCKVYFYYIRKKCMQASTSFSFVKVRRTLCSPYDYSHQKTLKVGAYFVKWARKYMRTSVHMYLSWERRRRKKCEFTSSFLPATYIRSEWWQKDVRVERASYYIEVCKAKVCSLFPTVKQIGMSNEAK